MSSLGVLVSLLQKEKGNALKNRLTVYGGVKIVQLCWVLKLGLIHSLQKIYQFFYVDEMCQELFRLIKHLSLQEYRYMQTKCRTNLFSSKNCPLSTQFDFVAEVNAEVFGSYLHLIGLCFYQLVYLLLFFWAEM